MSSGVMVSQNLVDDGFYKPGRSGKSLMGFSFIKHSSALNLWSHSNCQVSLV